VPPSLPVYPRSHLQATAAELPVESVRDGPVVVSEHDVHVASVLPVLVEYVSIGQAVHGADPIVVLYFPGTQAVHSEPSFPVYPAWHVHFRSASVPATDCEPAGHCEQVLAVAPTAVEYQFAAQFVHAAEPEPILYVPATHELHPHCCGVL